MTLAAAAGLLALCATAAPAPLPWQEPAPLARLFLQPALEAPEVAPAGSWRGEVRLHYDSSLLLERSEALSIDIHEETAQVTALVGWGAGAGVELQLALPAIVDTGGFLDGPIARVEGWFDARNPHAVGRPRNLSRFRVLDPAGQGISRDGAEGGLGDVRLGARWALRGAEGPLPALALRGAVKLPTGRLPFGGGTTDAALGLLAAWRGPALSLVLALDAAVPGGELRTPRIRTRPYGAAQAGLAWSLGAGFGLHLQGSAHLSPLRGTGIGAVDGPTFYLLGGLSAELPGGLEACLGAVENVFSPYRGADFAFLLVLRGR